MATSKEKIIKTLKDLIACPATPKEVIDKVAKTLRELESA